MQVSIEGIVEEIIFTNEVNGYTVCDIKDGSELVTAVGYMPFLNPGEIVKICGRWVTHPDYGEQLKVETYEKVLPQTVDSIERYLSSGVIKGIGPATARKIVEKFKEETLNIFRVKPERLSEIKGISLSKALKMGQAFEEQRGLVSVVMFLQEYGISPTYSAKIYKAFGASTIDVIKANPYKLADEVFGIGFKTVDRIAGNIGIDPKSKYRISSGIKYILGQAAANGHTYLPNTQLKEYTSRLLEVDIEDLRDSLVSLMLDKSVIVDKTEIGENVYLNSFYYAELYVCRKLMELSSVSFKNDPDDFERAIEKIESQENINLAHMQREAVKEALQSGLLVITGGPGTGKTTIIKSIIMLLNKEGFEVALAAPTGRAAKRMTEATGFEAKTIHRLLEIGYMGEGSELLFGRNESNPVDADAVIIDEMSMVDTLLMNHLLKAIAPGTRLILVGDVDQLPSVGAGNVLKDILNSECVKTVCLTEIFRQAGESMIIVNAHKINRGEPPYMNAKEKDFFFMPRGSGNDIVKTIIDLCSRRLPNTYDYDPMKHIQVLTPTKKGLAGVYNLNIELQKALNPPSKGINEKIYRDYIFREGDRVMQIRNNYNLRWFKNEESFTEGEGVFNGDTGLIKEVDNEEHKIVVQFEDDRIVEYDYSILDELEPAFAITIHKSQGSEFPAVVLPLFPGPPILYTRNLLYTAITRAKDIVILVGYENVLYEMINNERETLRYSGLENKLKICFNQDIL